MNNVKTGKSSLFLLLLAGAMMLGTLYLIFIWVPTEKNLGISQRIFYIHVPVAWVGFLAFFFVLTGSVGYLFAVKSSNNQALMSAKSWDRFAYSAAEIGVLFMTLMLISGILWAKPVWGVWWTWDPRLSTSLILWLTYVAYLMLRAYSYNEDQSARYSAILGIAGFINVPIVYLSIVWWRTVHPQVLVGPAASGSLDPSMRMVLLAATATFTVLFIYLLVERMSLQKSEEQMEMIQGLGRTE